MTQLALDGPPPCDSLAYNELTTRDARVCTKDTKIAVPRANLILSQTPKIGNMLHTLRKCGLVKNACPHPLMANHQQHTTFSSLSGLVFGTLAWYPCGFPAVTCLLAGGLCSVGGMLPDIDIKTSRSFQDCMSITACITSMLVILRVSTMGVGAEMISIIGAAVFIAVKFGAGNLVQAFTVHRGMIHSIPFAVLCGEILFLTTAGDISPRFLKAAGLSLGFFSHLLLDEIYSVDVVKLSTKKSFGTALKFGMRKHLKLTVILYFLLFCGTFISFKQPNMFSEALDSAIDKIAELTIRGTQQFEVASLKAQQQLRSPGFKGSPASDTQPDEAERTTGSQLASRPEIPEPSSRTYPTPVLPTLETVTVAWGNAYPTATTPANPTANPTVTSPAGSQSNVPAGLQSNVPVGLSSIPSANLRGSPQDAVPRPSLRDLSTPPSAASQLPPARPKF